MIKINEVDISYIVEPIKHKVIIFFNHSFLINNYTEDYLEQNKLFAICFDTTPLKNLKDMRNYQEILNIFPNSSRVLGKCFYIGNYKEKDFNELISIQLHSLFQGSYEVIKRESEYTYNKNQ